jgi:hypothetical protein
MTWTVPTPTDSTMQDSVTTLPVWLTGTRVGSVLRVVARCCDALGDYVTAAVQYRFPGYYGDDTLPALGRERRIFRGPDEPSAGYSGRLSIFRQTHKRAGGWAVALEQIQAYWTGSLYLGNPFAPKIQAISNAAKQIQVDTDGTLSVSSVSWNWDADSPPVGPKTAHPSRYWVVMYMPDGIAHTTTGMQWGKGKKWGDGHKWGDGTLWGTSATRAQVDSLRQILAAWNPPNAQCETMIVVYNYAAWGGDMPDGTWDRWRNRNQYVSYMNGTKT